MSGQVVGLVNLLGGTALVGFAGLLVTQLVQWWGKKAETRTTAAGSREERLGRDTDRLFALVSADNDRVRSQLTAIESRLDETQDELRQVRDHLVSACWHIRELVLVAPRGTAATIRAAQFLGQVMPMDASLAAILDPISDRPANDLTKES